MSLILPFRKCRSDILSAVDNFALVNLDIVWCYQQLRNIDELPDAGQYKPSLYDHFSKNFTINYRKNTFDMHNLHCFYIYTHLQYKQCNRI